MNRRHRVFALLLSGFIAAVAQAKQMPKVATYTIDVAYENEEPGIVATADISFAEDSMSPSTLIFYLHGELRVDQVAMDGVPAEVTGDVVFYQADYSNVARRFRIEMSGRELPKVLTIRYHGKINPSVVAAPSNYMRVDGDGVFLRSFLYSVWFPVFLEADHDSYPVDADVTVRTPGAFMAVVTGERLSDLVEGESRISRWKIVQEDLFNIQLTARPFEHIEEDGLHLYFLPDAAAHAFADKILSFSAQLAKSYQTNYADRGEGEQLHVVQMPRFGDISSGNMVGISDRVWLDFDPVSYSGRTLAHELVHPYVQIPLPRSSRLYALVIEGFPSYFHLPAMAEIIGDDFYQQTMEKSEDAYLKNRQTGLDRRGNRLPAEKPILALTAEDIGIYKDRFVLNDRVLLFCNWLRSQMGVDQFGRFTKDLFSRSSLDYDGLVSTVQTYLPESTDELNVWLRTTDFPDAYRLDRSAGE